MNELTSNQNQMIETEDYTITRDENGKFRRQAKYKFFSSVQPETREQKMNLLNLIDGDEAISMNSIIGSEITIADVICNPYDSINEETGEITNGVNTFLITKEGKGFVTSSKSVYFTLNNIMKVFGEPHWNDDEAITVKVVKKKGQRFEYTDIKVIG